MSDFVIETSGLCKSFRGQVALNGLDLRVPEGSIFGFLGRNGAGKTTTIKLLMGMLRADAGSAQVFGMPVTESTAGTKVREKIGFVAEDKELYPVYDGGADHPLHPAVLSALARGSGEALLEGIRVAAAPQDSGFVEGHAFEADAVAGHCARGEAFDFG